MIHAERFRSPPALRIGTARSHSEAIAHKTRKGFNLIEAAIVLGVIGLVVGGIWVGASALSESMRVSKIASESFLIARNIQRLVSENDASAIGDCGGGGCIFFYSFFGRGVSKDIGKEFGGHLTVRTYSSPPKFELAFYDIPLSACIKLVTRLGKSGNGILTRMLINYAQEISSFPVSVALAETACKNNYGFTGQRSIVLLTFPYTRINN